MCAGWRRWRRSSAAVASPEIFLVRHGETEWSATGRHTSRTDLPLTAAGRERARRLRAQLSDRQFATVLCSPLLRARETCRLAGFGRTASIFEDLREWDYGDYEGLTTQQIQERQPKWSLWRNGCPGGEAPQDVAVRADRVLAAARAAGGEVIAFAHGHVLRAVAARWIGMEVAAGARLALSAGAVSVLGFEHQTEVLSRWNS
jgi:broad specificity phosphatase PhoE